MCRRMRQGRRSGARIRSRIRTAPIRLRYNNTSAPVQTYNSTFLNDATYAGGDYNSFKPTASYIENYIRNKLVTTTLTAGGTTQTLVRNYYDYANYYSNYA